MKLKITLIALCWCTFISAQTIREIQLPEPQEVSPFFVGPINKSTIHYGARPTNFNGKVIVFTHGFADLNQSQFLRNNSFYEDTFNAGYQAAFVATTRGKGFWVNGRILAKAIDIITAKYNVGTITMVAHSNGGKATEAAMYHYGKKDKINSVYTMATPYWGTYLADLSQLPFLNWVWRLTGLNQATRTSTTYYCRDVSRPYFDNHPDNEPQKFTSLAASGFYKGSPLTGAGGLILLAAKKGVNDGVTTYESSLRAGAKNVFVEKDPRALIDHLGASLGQFGWPYIQSYIENRSTVKTITDSKPVNRNIISSNYYITNSLNEYNTIVLDKNTDGATLEIIHETSSAPFQLIKNGTTIKQDVFSNTHKTVIEISDSNLKLESNSNYVAFVRQQNDITMSLETITATHTPDLKVSFHSKDQKITSLPVQVSGMITKTSAIDGSYVTEDTQIIQFENINGHYHYNTSELEDGVYSLLLTGTSEGKFKRSIISGFVVGNIEKSIANSDSLEVAEHPITLNNQKLILYPTVVSNQAVITGDFKTRSILHARIYTVNGKKVSEFTSLIDTPKQIDISNHVQSLQKGIYLVEIEGLGTTKFIKK